MSKATTNKEVNLTMTAEQWLAIRCAIHGQKREVEQKIADHLEQSQDIQQDSDFKRWHKEHQAELMDLISITNKLKATYDHA